MSEGRGLSPDETHYCTDPTCNAEVCNDLDHRTSGRVLSEPPHCEWCGTAIFPDFKRNWNDRHGDFACPANTDGHTHEPAERQP